MANDRRHSTGLCRFCGRSDRFLGADSCAMRDKKISREAAVAREYARRYQALVDTFRASSRLTADKEQIIKETIYATRNDRTGKNGRQHGPTTDERRAINASSSTCRRKRWRIWLKKKAIGASSLGRSRQEARQAAGRLVDGSGGGRGQDHCRTSALLEAGDILIDGGNSYYIDDIRRAKELATKRIHYVDVGTVAVSGDWNAATA